MNSEGGRCQLKVVVGVISPIIDSVCVWFYTTVLWSYWVNIGPQHKKKACLNLLAWSVRHYYIYTQTNPYIGVNLLLLITNPYILLNLLKVYFCRYYYDCFISLFVQVLNWAFMETALWFSQYACIFLIHVWYKCLKIYMYLFIEI